MNKISDLENNSDWKRSVGEKLDKVHCRNKHMHAVCDSITGNCDMHYDEHDPHESVTELVKHLADGNTGKIVLGLTLIVVLDQMLTGGQIRKSLLKSI